MFFRHKFVARKCACGDAFGFKVAPMLNFINVRDVEISADVLRAFIRRTKIGYNGVKLRFSDGVQHHGTQIRRNVLSSDLLAKLDTGMYLLVHHNLTSPSFTSSHLSLHSLNLVYNDRLPPFTLVHPFDPHWTKNSGQSVRNGS